MATPDKLPDKTKVLLLGSIVKVVALAANGMMTIRIAISHKTGPRKNALGQVDFEVVVIGILFVVRDVMNVVRTPKFDG